MKKNIKKVAIATVLFANSVMLFAQGAPGGGDVRGELNTLLSDYALPIVIAILVLSVVTGLITNMDKIIDKNGDGSRKEGIINVIWYLAYAILFCLVVAGVITLLNSKFQLQI